MRTIKLPQCTGFLDAFTILRFTNEMCSKNKANSFKYITCVYFVIYFIFEYDSSDCFQYKKQHQEVLILDMQNKNNNKNKNKIPPYSVQSCQVMFIL